MGTKGDTTRDRILREASRLFHRQGFGATTIGDLLEASGTTKGNLYFHFNGKDEIALAVLRRAGDAFRQFLDTALQGPTPGAALEQFFTRALEKHRGSGFVGGCLFGNTALEASDTAPDYAALVQEVFTAWTGRLGATIAAAQQTGEVRTDLPADHLAELVVAAMEGGIMQARLRKDEKPLGRVLDGLRSVLALRVAKLPQSLDEPDRTIHATGDDGPDRKGRAPDAGRTD